MSLSYDLIIRGGNVVEGTGNPWYSGDVAVKDGKIVAIGNLPQAEAEAIIDASGLIVAPGFIDAHSHADGSTLYYRNMESLVMQGITTVMSGQCGSSPAPVNPDFREEMEKRTGEVWNQVVEEKQAGLEAAARIVQANVRRGIQTFVNVNNHYEGSAPLTIQRCLQLLGEQEPAA